jgi:hypothetical protein
MPALAEPTFPFVAMLGDAPDPGKRLFARRRDRDRLIV